MLHGAVDHDGDGFRSLAERHSGLAKVLITPFPRMESSSELSESQFCSNMLTRRQLQAWKRAVHDPEVP